jgi:hypothetical protein
MFGNGCNQENQETVKAILQVDEKYLGLPTPEGRMTKNKFKTMNERLINRFTNLVERSMSMGAQEVLIKSVAQAIPTYTMGIFKLPKTLCDEMTQLMRRFWWGGGGEAGRRKIHWISWDKLLMPKSFGDMGFRDLRLFNQALLARQAWRILQFPESLCAQVLRAKYYPQGELTDTAFLVEASPTWLAIIHGLELLKKGIIWRVGSGSKIQLWHDPWIPRAPSRRISLRKG